MKIYKSVKNTLSGLKATFKRFPETIFFTTATAVLIIIMQHTETTLRNDPSDFLRRLTMIIALGIPLSLLVRLIFERKPDISKTIKLILYILSILLLVLSYFLLLRKFDMSSITRYTALSIAIYVGAIFAPYFYRKESFELYVVRLSARAIVTVVYSLILFGGLSAIFFTVQNLFVLNMTDKIYFDMWLATAGIFAPCFFLAKIPKQDEKFKIDDYPGFLKVLLLYLLLPLISVYMVILYAYFAKIIITQQWPEGIITHLVLWYSLISIAILFFIAPLNRISKWSKTFRTWLPRLAIPLIIMMFVSIIIRINEYGITESRYYVVSAGLGSIGIMVYYISTKNVRNIVLPILLSVLTILSVFGPWSSFSVSKASQNRRLENILNKYDMIKDGAIYKTTFKVDRNDMVEVTEILRYFSNMHDFDDVIYLPEDFSFNDMNQVFGFTEQYPNYNGSKMNYISYYLRQLDKPIDISGYQYFFDYSDYRFRDTQEKDGLRVNYSRNNTLIIIYENDELIYEKDLYDFASELISKSNDSPTHELTLDEAVIKDENERLRLKYVFYNIYGNFDSENDKNSIDEISFNLFLELK